MSHIRYIVAHLCLAWVLSQLFLPFVYAEDTQEDFNEAKTQINAIQVTNPILPNSVTEQRGRVWEILKRLFDAQGRIWNWYIKALRNVENNAVMRWSGGKDGFFLTGSIYDTGTNVGIWESTPNFSLDISGDINFTGDLRKNGVIYNPTGKFQDGVPTAADAVYTWGWNVGIGLLNPSEALTVVGRISVTGDPNSDDDVGDRAYNDARYLNTTEKATDADLLDGLDSTAFVRTTTNQTIAGIKTFSSTIAGSINGNSATATALETARTIGFSGVISGSASFDGTSNITIATTLADNSITSEKILDGEVSSADITDGTIVNADISGSAAIAGTKIVPNFGSQNIVTTGDVNMNEFRLANQEPGALTSDGNVGFDSSRGLIIYRTQQVGQEAGNGTYTVLDTSNITGGSNITITNTAGGISGTEAITFNVNDGPGSGLDADTLDGIDSAAFVQTSWNQTVAGTKTFSSTIVGDVSWNAGTATTLQTARNIWVNGDINGFTTFDGSASVYINSTIGNGVVTGAKISADTITAANIAADAVGASELANNAVASANIINGSVASVDITDNTIAAIDIAANAVGASELADNSVASANIIDGTIVREDIGVNQIYSNHIVDGVVSGTDIATDTITAWNIAANAVGASELDNTGDYTVSSVSTTNQVWLSWENGVNNITYNDGGGNVQIRFGNDYSSSDERFTHAGTAYYVWGNLDSSNGTLQLKVASNGGAGDDQAVAWWQTLAIGASTLTWDGNDVLTSASSVDADTLDGYDSTDFVNVFGDQTVGGIKTFTGTIVGDISGNAGTATALETARNIALSGHLSGSASFNGTSNITIASTISNGVVNSAKITDNSIAAVDIAADAVGASELANNAVASANIIDGSVTSADIANDTITEADISNAFVARDSNLLDGIDSTGYVQTSGNQTIGGIKTFTSPLRVVNTFNINGTTTGTQQDGLYVADLWATIWTTNNPNYTAAIVGQINSIRSIALSVDASWYLWWFRSHNGAWPYTFQSKSKWSDDAGLLDGIDSTGFIQVGTSGDQIQNGTIDSSEIEDNTIASSDILNNTITEADISDAFVARDSSLLDGLDSTAFIRSNANDDVTGHTEWQDNYEARFGAGADMTLSHNGTASLIVNNTGELYFRNNSDGDRLIFQSTNAWGTNRNLIVADPDNYVDLYYAGSRKLRTLNNGVEITGTVTADDPTAGSHLATKNYVDTLVTQGVTWKAPVESGQTIVGTWGACDASKQSWTTYNKNDDIIYICDGSAWLSIGSSASIPYATTTTAGKVQIAGDIQGTWNNITLKNGVVDSAAITNGSITSTDIATDTIAAADIAAWAVGTSELATDSVVSSKILNNTITASDIGPDAVNSSEITDGAVRTQEILNGTIVSADIAANTITASNLAANSVWDSELIDVPTVTQLNIASGVGNGVRFWGSDSYEIAMGNTAEYQYWPVNNYSIKMNMSNTAGRGWTWWVSGAAPKTALEVTTGNFQTAGSITAASFSGNGAGLTNVSADTLDGLDSTQFLRSDTDDTFAGTLTISNTAQTSGASTVSHLELYSPNTWDNTNEVSMRFHQWSQYYNQIRVRTGGFRFTAGNNDSVAPITAGVITGTSFTGDGAAITNIAGDNIQNGTIDGSEIQDNSLAAADIAANAIGASELADNSVASANIINGSVTSADIANNTITETDISDAFVARDSSLLDGIDSTQFLRSDIADTMLNELTISNATYGNHLKLERSGHEWEISPSTDGSVNFTHPAWGGQNRLEVPGLESTARITVGETNVMLWGDSGDNIQDGTIDGSEIQDNSLAAADLAADSVGASELADNSVASANIINGSIASADIAANAVGNTELDNSADFTVRTLTATDGFGLAWENGVNRITNNDGGGNVQIRFGHDYTSTAERFTHAGTAYYIWGAMDNANGALQLKVASNGGAGNDQVVTWGSTLSISDTALTWDGNDVLTDASNIDADTLDGIDSTAFVQTTGNQTVSGIKTFNGTLQSFHNDNVQGTNVKFGRSTSQYITMHGGSSGNFLTSVSTDTVPKNLTIRANRGATNQDFVFNSANGSLTAASFIGNGASITNIAGDNITNGTIDSSEIQDNTLTASDLAANSVGNSELIDNPTVSSLTVWSSLYSSYSGTPISSLVNGTTWGWLIETPDNSHMVVGIRENDVNDSFSIVSGGWNYSTDSTYDTLVANFDANGNVSLGGNLTLAGTLSGDSITDGTIDSSEIQDNTIASGDILNNTITENDISDAFVARDSQLLDGFNSSQNSWGNTVTVRDGNGDINARLFRSEYDSTNANIGFIMTQVDTASNNYMRPSTPAQFRAAVIDGNYIAVGGSGDQIQNGTIDSSEIQDNTLTANDLAANSVGNSELNNSDNFTVNQLFISSTSDAALASTAHGLTVWPASSTNVIIDGNEIMARNNGATSTLYIQNDGGTTSFGGVISGNGSSITNINGDNITDWTIDSSEIQNDTLTASDLAANSVGDSELIDNPTVSNLWIWAVHGQGIRFWNSDSYKIYMSAVSNGTWGGRLDSTSDYNMYFRMTSGTNRGFVFRNNVTNVAQIEGNGNIRTIGNFIGNGSQITSISGDNITNGTIDSSEIQNDTLTASDLAANSVGNSEINNSESFTFGAITNNGNLNMTDGDIYNIREIEIKDYDDNTGGWDNKYRILGRDGAWQFYNGWVVVGNYSNGTWTDVPDGNLIVESRVGIGTTPSGVLASNNSLAIGDGDTGFKLLADGNLGMYANGTERVRLEWYTFQVGHGEGAMWLTINDGGGNANLTFNHRNRIPDQNGNSGRIAVNVDATSGAAFTFGLASNVTSGASIGTTDVLVIQDDGDIQLGGSSRRIDNVTCIGNCF